MSYFDFTTDKLQIKPLRWDLISNTNLTDHPTNNSQSIDSAIDNLTKNLQHAIEASVFTPKYKNSSLLLPNYIKHELTEKTRYVVNGRETVTRLPNVN